MGKTLKIFFFSHQHAALQLCSNLPDYTTCTVLLIQPYWIKWELRLSYTKQTKTWLNQKNSKSKKYCVTNKICTNTNVKEKNDLDVRSAQKKHDKILKATYCKPPAESVPWISTLNQYPVHHWRWPVRQYPVYQSVQPINAQHVKASTHQRKCTCNYWMRRRESKVTLTVYCHHAQERVGDIWDH